MKMEKFDKAIKHANKIIEKNPNWDDPNFFYQLYISN